MADPRARVPPAKWWFSSVHGDFESEEHQAEVIAWLEARFAPVSDTDSTPLRDADYWIGQFERGEETGRVHIQCTISFKTKVRPNSVATWYAQIPHVTGSHDEKVKSIPDAIVYCSKESTRVQEIGEFGPRPKEGKANELVRAAGMVREGASMREIAQSFPGAIVRYGRGLRELQQLLQAPEDEGQAPTPPGVCLYYGPSGTRKSTLARTWRDAGWRCYIIPVGDSLWFDNYEGQQLVIFDEYHGQFALQQLLRLLDGFPVQVPRKGGFTWYNPKRVAFTSTKHPGEWYNYYNRLDEWTAIKRRFTRVVDTSYDPPRVLTGDDMGGWFRGLIPRIEEKK